MVGVRSWRGGGLPGNSTPGQDVEADDHDDDLIDALDKDMLPHAPVDEGSLVTMRLVKEEVLQECRGGKGMLWGRG